jgi:hypothetical protein
MSKKYTFEEIKEIAAKCKNKTELLHYGGAYNAAKNMGIFETVCSHMPANSLSVQDPHNKIWDKESLCVEASKFLTRSAMKKHNPSAFNAAKLSGFLNELFPNRNAFRNEAYSLSEIETEIRKYCSKCKFKEKNPYLYRKVNNFYNMSALFKNEADYLIWRKAQFGHMQLSSNVSRSETNLLDFIRSKFPKAQTYRDRKVKIEGRPHITGLDVDIYIPELRKGIEFDGTYWHSIAGLKRSRFHWPDSDLHSYHEIKDSYFKSKNIELLHIDEKDWLQNQESCIAKVCTFLGIKI